MTRPRHPHREAGVALLSVLLLVAVMTVLVVAMLDDIRFGLRRAGNAQAMEQARWHALGIADLVEGQLQALQAARPGLTLLEGDWEGTPRQLPVAGDRPGVATVRVDDGGNCFNLNSVVEGAPEQWQRNAIGTRQYQALLVALDIPAAQATPLVDALVDWIDSDASPQPSGREDAGYARERPARLTAGALLAEPSELRAIAGYGPDVYARLRPWVCALPDDTLSPLNINTLRPDDAPLLAMLSLGALQPAQARALIAARPGGGWRDDAAFWSQPALAAANVPNPVIAQTALRTRFFDVDVRVALDDADAVLTQTLEDTGNGRFTLVARRWTPDE